MRIKNTYFYICFLYTRNFVYVIFYINFLGSKIQVFYLYFGFKFFISNVCYNLLLNDFYLIIISGNIDLSISLIFNKIV